VIRKATVQSALVFALAAICWLPASAAGTARIQHPNGTSDTYSNVRISVHDGEMSLTSADGIGRVDIGKAACSKAGDLIECLPYDAMLFQHGRSLHIALTSGSVILNPTDAAQPLSASSQRIPPHGVVLSMQSKNGTFVYLTGTVDEFKK
jgi:hypothetical protein